jgi:hypothetical protein
MRSELQSGSGSPPRRTVAVAVAVSEIEQGTRNKEQGTAMCEVNYKVVVAGTLRLCDLA